MGYFHSIMSQTPAAAAPPEYWDEEEFNVVETTTGYFLAYFMMSLVNPDNTAQANVYAVRGEYTRNMYNTIGSGGHDLVLTGWVNQGARFHPSPGLTPRSLRVVTPEWDDAYVIVPVNCSPTSNGGNMCILC